MSQVVLQTVSPDGHLSLTIKAYTSGTPAFSVSVSGAQGVYLGIPFGYPASGDQVTVNWNLPDSVVGIFIADECWLLYRWGPRRRRNRVRYRRPPNTAFTAEEIDWFCAKTRLQPRRV